jgi:hypothetical protein
MSITISPTCPPPGNLNADEKRGLLRRDLFRHFKGISRSGTSSVPSKHMTTLEMLAYRWQR